MEKRENRPMDTRRKPWTGVVNIIRFNWPFYAIAGVMLLLLTGMAFILPAHLSGYVAGLTLLITLPVIISLLVSWYVYDLSGMYGLRWLSATGKTSAILNVHAGFDEWSGALKEKFPQASITIMDFYDPSTHTEPSIARARKAFPPSPQSWTVKTASLPTPDEKYHQIMLFFAAHEVRLDAERITLFKELHRVSTDDAQLHIIEHLRDLPNFLAYTVGFLHFLPAHKWRETFAASGWHLKTQENINPFVTYFTLTKS